MSPATAPAAVARRRTAPRHRRRCVADSSSASRLRERLRREDGNALVEFIAVSVVLLIPLLYLVLMLGSVQSAIFAADVIARDTARIHATVADPGDAAHRASVHEQWVLEDFGLRPGASVTVSCSDDPCATPGGAVTATVRIAVPVPGIGPLLGSDGPVAVSSERTAPVDQYRAPRP